MTAILLLGASGQIGYELSRTLAPLGKIVAPGRNECDLARPETIVRTVNAAAPALIVNAAAYTDVDGAETPEGRRAATAINAEGPATLAKAAAGARIPIIHYSTDYVFDGTKGAPYREDDEAVPINAYGQSKHAGERMIAASGAAHLIFRTSWIYGNRGRNFLRTMLRLASEQKDLRVVCDQVGSPTWARTVAEATAAILGRCWKPGAADALSGLGGTYHVAAAGETSWHGFAQAIMAAAGRNVPVRAIATAEFPRPAKRPAYSVLDCGKAARVFGVALPDWRDQLAACLTEKADA